jgi:hypothetical protein
LCISTRIAIGQGASLPSLSARGGFRGGGHVVVGDDDDDDDEKDEKDMPLLPLLPLLRPFWFNALAKAASLGCSTNATKMSGPSAWSPRAVPTKRPPALVLVLVLVPLSLVVEGAPFAASHESTIGHSPYWLCITKRTSLDAGAAMTFPICDKVELPAAPLSCGWPAWSPKRHSSRLMCAS